MSIKQKNILVVDDEESIVEVIKAYLEKDGYYVYIAYDGRRALDIARSERLDFIVLDLMLPDVMGEDICKEIRSYSKVPILMLTAKVNEGDKINGLDSGADDYLIKPFSPKELLARIRAILRRTGNEDKSNLSFNNGDLQIDIDKMEIRKGNKNIELTSTEFKILALLATNKGRIFSREELINRVLGYDYEGYDRTIDTHIKNIRQKVESEGIKYIATVYGAGYKFLEG
ncbi:MAG: response regulator transcription factor [Flavobacteriales bacterium]|nr:response regulator transcription factor [Flavobacteriales bacterium]